MDDLLSLVQEIYATEPEARAVLARIGYPMAQTPRFDMAHTFWPQVLGTLDNKVQGGRIKLLKAAAENNPGSPAGELLARFVDAGDQVAAIPVTAVIGPATLVALTDGDGPPSVPPGPLSDEQGPSDSEDCPTLTLEGADLSDPFFAEVTTLLGRRDVELLYVTPLESAVRIPDPGRNDEAVRHAIQQRMRGYEPSCRVTYRKFSFRPYAYQQLAVYGPDGSKYLLTAVPATSTPEDVAAALIAQTREVGTTTRGGLVRVVIDHDSASFSKRLDPYTTLHECGVREDSELRVAPEAVAGCVAPELRMRAVLRAVAQLRGYAARHPDFTIVDHDDDELPTRITVLIGKPGLAPPVDLDRDRAAENGTDTLAPVVQHPHRVSLHFRAMFPLVAPLVVWDTPVFHPNIRCTADGEFPVGTLQFHPLLLDYRPEFDLANVARVLTDVAMYRDYDLVAGPSSPDPVAAEWAGTEAGQTMIKAIGGRLLADVVREGDRRSRPPRLLWTQPLPEVPRGH